MSGLIKVPVSCATKIFFHNLEVASGAIIRVSSALRSACVIPLAIAVKEASMLVVKFCTNNRVSGT